MKIGFIGCGSMGGAILNGCLQKGFFKPEQVTVCEKDADRLSYIINTYGVKGVKNPQEAAECSDAVLLGVKPQALPALLTEIGAYTAQKRILFI